MPTYKCKVTKASLFEAVIEVEANSANMAGFLAEQLAATYDGPWNSLGYEYDCGLSDVEIGDATEINEPERKVGRHPALGMPYGK